MQKIFSSLLAAFILATGMSTVIAGTLDDAPFRIVLPSEDWKLNDSSAQDMGKNVFLVASITNTNSRSKSVIIKTELENPSATSLDELVAGMRDQLSNPAVKQLSDDETVFLGLKARRFSYLINGSVYNVALVFVSGKNGWTVASVGSLEQKTEIQKLITFYKKK
jgi:hypothetical protein